MTVTLYLLSSLPPPPPPVSSSLTLGHYNMSANYVFNINALAHERRTQSCIADQCSSASEETFCPILQVCDASVCVRVAIIV